MMLKHSMRSSKFALPHTICIRHILDILKYFVRFMKYNVKHLAVISNISFVLSNMHLKHFVVSNCMKDSPVNQCGSWVLGARYQWHRSCVCRCVCVHVYECVYLYVYVYGERCMLYVYV